MSLKNDFVNSKGRRGELYACELLKKEGFRIIDRNFRSMFGEIDVIAVKKDEIYFCEVKTRWNNKYGTPQDSVTKSKLLKIIKTSEYYLKVRNISNTKVHILVISQLISEGKIKEQSIIPFD